MQLKNQQYLSRILVIFIIYGTMFFFGFIENVKGVSYPLIRNEFDVSYETIGLMISLNSFSYTLLIVVAGFMLSRFAIKKIFAFGFICSLLGIASIYFAGYFWMAAVSLIIVFAGFGIGEISVNSVATKIFLKKPALMMNLLHFMYGAGAIGGPMVAGFLANPAGMGLSWRMIYLLTIPLILIIFIPALFTKFPILENKTEDSSSENGNKKKTINFIYALKTPSVWIFGIILGFMVSIEVASANWGGLYFLDLYGMDPTTSGARFVSAFFGLFTLSRLVSGFIIEKIGYMRSLIGAMILTAGIFIIGFVTGAAGIHVLPLLGFPIGILWPTVIALAIGRFGSNAPVMTAAIIAISGLFTSGLQYIMGSLNQWIGPAWGYRSCLLFCIIIIGMLVGFKGHFRKS